jgi:uncharacterized protein YunC (DUF1805 family)
MQKPIIKQIEIGNKKINTVVVKLAKADLIIACAEKGFVMCGYLNIDTAEKMKDAACIVRGVKNVEELLAKPVVSITDEAKKLGINIGDTGARALEKML